MKTDEELFSGEIISFDKKAHANLQFRRFADYFAAYGIYCLAIL